MCLELGFKQPDIFKHCTKPVFEVVEVWPSAFNTKSIVEIEAMCVGQAQAQRCFHESPMADVGVNDRKLKQYKRDQSYSFWSVE